MADTLEIFGTEYTGVTGIIATDDNGNDLTYTRGGSGVDIPVFTWADNIVTCNKTFNQIQQYFNGYNTCAILIEDQEEDVNYPVVLSGYDDWENPTYANLFAMANTGPALSFKYYANGAITIPDLYEFFENPTITQNGDYYPSDGKVFGSVYVNVPSSTPTLQSKTVTPTEWQQSITADSGYTGLGTVTVNGIPLDYVGSGVSRFTLSEDCVIEPSEIQQEVMMDGEYLEGGNIYVGAISSTYVGSGITRRSSSDLTVSNATVTAPAGYYAEAASKSVSSMTLPTSAASSATSGYTSKATIGRSTAAQYINIPPGYNSAGAYYVISAVANGSATAPASISGTAASVSTGTNTLTLTKTVSVTPTVSAGYVSSGTAGNSSVSLTASVTIDPTPTASGATVTIPAGYYTEATSKAVTTMTLPTSAASSATSGYTKKATISRSTSTQYINIAPGYNSAGGYYEISAVANGSATGPSSLSGTSATVSTGTNTLTLTKTGVTTTPTVSAGYVSSATASTATVTLTASVTTKAAATITPTTTNQTIAAGTYLTGTQTIAGDADLVGSNILSTANIFGVQGTVDFVDVYIRSAAPTPSVGNDGDIYIQE